tara:strand:- start:2305 stop:2469 length:165 start_codon:yes stop_codon:yes gene_type:complete
MYKLGEERIFCLAEGSDIIEKKGIIVGRTREETPFYDFKVGDEIFHHIPENGIR